MLSKLLAVSMLLGLVACGQVSRMSTETSLPSAIPALHIKTDTSVFDLKISKLEIDVKVVGNIATTTFDITFYNGLGRELEGEFDFPLADGQTISRYALDINGVMREGVVVEKQTARIAFETTVRRKIDPGLVEKTRGNSFRTRIFPIPANGTKRVVIGIEEMLTLTEDGYRYKLPVATAEGVDHFKLSAETINCESKPIMNGNEFAEFSFAKDVDTYSGSIEKLNFHPSHLFAFTIPLPASGYTVYAETYSGKTYFYLNTLIEGTEKPRKKPKSIGVLWDVSSSAEKRNREKDLELLKEYIDHVQNVTIVEIPFDISAHPQKQLSITNGEAATLIKDLKEYSIDGGTQLGAIDLSKYDVEEFLLFSDGISSFGKKEMVLGKVPVVVINSSSEADHAYLKFVASKTNGHYIDLTKMTVDEAIKSLQNEPLRSVSTITKNGSIEEIVSSREVLQSGFALAGILNGSSAILELSFGYGNEVVTTKRIEIIQPFENDYNNIKRIWASMKIDELSMRYEKNKDEITALGKEHSIVTQNTSLIVLDRVEDYVQHKIIPPPELRKEYAALIAQQTEIARDEKAEALDEAVASMNELKDWYGKKFDTTKRKMVQQQSNGEVSAITNVEISSPTTLRAPEANASISRVSGEEMKMEEVTVSGLSLNYSNSTYVMTDSTAVFGSGATSSLYRDLDGVDDRFDAGFEQKKSIELKAWKPDVAYLKLMEKTAEAKWLETYFELKKKYHAQPSFFIDMARFFYEKNQAAIAARVLSNIAELKLAEPELLRIMAYQLLNAGDHETAVETFKEVLELRGEHPQSHRDLALAYAEKGEYQQAVDILYAVLTKNWDGRFTGIKSIALMEMNALIGAYGSMIKTDSIDKRFIYAMPVDVRIVIGWSADNTDVDLWVTEPNGEKCDYSHNRTVVGGRMSQDITQGFGPEEYLLKKAPSGKYKIEVNLYGDSRQSLSGPITIKADLYTHYGKPTQKKRTINFRVDSDKEVVEIGALDFVTKK